MPDQSMDSLYINDIRAFGYTGALPPENELGQWFRVDLVLRLELATAGSSDVLADTHDYGGTIAAIQDMVRHRPFKLVEALASEIARIVLQRDERLSQITVKLTKLTPPVPDFTGTIAVEITRDRAHLATPTPPPLPRQE